MRILIATTALALGFASVTPSLAQASLQKEAQRVAAYDRFRELFDAGRYEAALPLARTVLELTEAADPQHEELPTAYNNLGVVQFRVGDLEAAESSFDTALELLENTEAISSRRLISPLAGLGAVYAASGQPARAADVLHRAIAISRRAKGLFNVEQLDLIESLIDAYERLGNLEGIERERRYTVQIVQQAYGVDDPRTVPALTHLADWYEDTNRYPMARLQWGRVTEIGMREGNGRNAATINGLLGIARTHRLQFVRDPESLSGPPTSLDPVTGRADPIPFAQERYGAVRLAPDGERAALRALEILDSTSEPPTVLLMNALMELGDWYMTGEKPAEAMPYYQRAWPLFSDSLVEGGTNPLLAPRPLLYRPPAAASRNLGRAEATTYARPLEFSLTVTASGETAEVTPVSQGPDGELSQVRRALERARFSPRFDDGQPVVTEGYRFVEHWIEVLPDSAIEPGADSAQEPGPGEDNREAEPAGKD
jgi:tetratricopeptide (TPR) repeat protein